MFSVLCVCQSVCPGEGMGLLMWPLPTMHWTSLYRHETWDHPPHYYHLVAITDDLFKIVHSRTPTHRYWYLVAWPPKHTRLASGWYASYYFLITVRNIVAARLFSWASVTLFTGGCIPACTGADTPWEDTPRADTPLPGRHITDGHCSRWYASYWNTFLLKYVFRHSQIMKNIVTESFKPILLSTVM